MITNAIIAAWALFWASALHGKRHSLHRDEVIGVIAIVAAPIICVLLERHFP